MTATTARPNAPDLQRVAFKSSRRTVRKPQAKTLLLFDQITAVMRRYERMTVRQLFYQLSRAASSRRPSAATSASPTPPWRCGAAGG